jgi:hypothetical protein
MTLTLIKCEKIQGGMSGAQAKAGYLLGLVTVIVEVFHYYFCPSLILSLFIGILYSNR